MSMRTLVLGSTSPYRRELMQRLQCPFEIAAPNIDETRQAHERPQAMVSRLSLAKAQAVASHYPNALIIGSDQCAVLGQDVLGKPGTYEKAVQQLCDSSGKTVYFFTGLCLLDTHTGRYQLDVIPFEVTFRLLKLPEIQRYVEKDQPYNCAGSFRSESLGITLFKRMRGDDPTALMGLPLIRLSEMLRQVGVDLLA